MEILAKRNTALYVQFPMVNNIGEFVADLDDLDSEYSYWDVGDAPSAFADCENESTENGSTGIYYLLLTAAELDYDLVDVQIKSDTADVRTQYLKIRTYEETSIDVGAIADAVWDEPSADHTDAGTFGELLAVLINSGMADVVATYATAPVVDQGITQDMADTNRCIQYWTIQYSPDLNFAVPDKTRYILARYDANMKLVEKKPSVNTTW